MMVDTGVKGRRIKVTRKVVDFGKPYGACDIDDWILRQHALTFCRMTQPTADFVNSGILAGYVDGPCDLEAIGSFTYDSSICGFPNQDTAVFSGTTAAYSTQNHVEADTVVSALTIGAVVSFLDLGLVAGEIAFVAGVKHGDTDSYALAIGLKADGTLCVIQDGLLVLEGPQAPIDTPVFCCASVSVSGLVRVMCAGVDASIESTAPLAMEAASRFDVGACVEADALVTKLQDSWDLVPYTGRLERVFFSRSAVTPRTALIAQNLITLKTYYMPQHDFDSAPSG